MKARTHNDLEPKPRLGVSACLLGQKVRYNGQHKLDEFIVNTLGPCVDFVPVCPEVECGMPVPREPMSLVGNPASPRLVTHNTGRDLTGQMLEWADRRVVELESENLAGFIFKTRSPSSGMQHIKVFKEDGKLAGFARGLFADRFIRHFPLLPVEDDGRLHDPGIRENFLERVFTLSRYRKTVVSANPLPELTQFHAEHKFLLMAHSQVKCRLMGNLLGSAGKHNTAGIRSQYEQMLLNTLALPATPKKHANVLQHMMGFLKQHLSADEKQELLELVQSFRNELVPLIVPVTMLSHYAYKYRVEYLTSSHYLNPTPLELKLRNHA